ncbi:HNH endonuclease [Pseudomonas sp. RTC3]|uniref:HNH endonuclease n=1 Tax=unclassified Pseudomonas TaxID=196821 RepID=UPI002AB4CD3D|nr:MULTISPECIES: HNH endonuclease [unclassified Pseudomonas]MEB0062467.1 HNH endonuclease [Pseudomonas sp. RTC3]MDY7565798.1 HNH endonuclease [Pseudomonas sp. 5C2]MEB0027585.1 HNH endonuclease [Pseudomonas sp. MH9.2]MEB0240472.1 HNH endonuclease [Pseudomonas sp. 5C2]WPX70357.1 HNH endonuclease [Pseudomonas sp. MH9.2]
MSRLTTLKSRMTQVEGRKLGTLTPAECAGGWGSGRGGRPWRRKRESILLRDKYTCQKCGVVTLDLEVDHIVNIAQGGNDDDANLQALCVPCHHAKTAAEAAQGGGW